MNLNMNVEKYECGCFVPSVSVSLSVSIVLLDSDYTTIEIYLTPRLFDTDTDSDTDWGMRGVIEHSTRNIQYPMKYCVLWLSCGQLH